MLRIFFTIEHFGEECKHDILFSELSLKSRIGHFRHLLVQHPEQFTMVLRKLLQLLMAHPRFGPIMIQRLSESWPIRRAARFTAYLYLRGKQAVEENLAKANQDLRKKVPESGTRVALLYPLRSPSPNPMNSSQACEYKSFLKSLV